MTRFVAFEPPGRAGVPRPGTSEDAVFVRDAFSIWAFLFPVLWLLRYRLFVSALIVLLLHIGLWRMMESDYRLLAMPLLLLLNLLVALEGPELRARRFRRRRYSETAAMDAAHAGEAAILYYAGTGLQAAPGGRARAETLPWRFERPVASKGSWWRRQRPKAVS